VTNHRNRKKKQKKLIKQRDIKEAQPREAAIRHSRCSLSLSSRRPREDMDVRAFCPGTKWGEGRHEKSGEDGVVILDFSVKAVG
jgi:hypothetical protein